MLLLSDRPARSVDEAVAIGERLSAVLLSAYFGKMGFAADAVNAAEVVVTDAVFGNASPLMELTAVKAAARIRGRVRFMACSLWIRPA
jgi:aspartate kinase